MAQYMLLIYANEADQPEFGSPEQIAARAAWGEVTAGMRESGAFVAGDPLQSVMTATTVRRRDGELLVTDGPFAETREMLGGYYLLDVPDLDAALEWAGKLPNLPYGSVEVRPVMAM